MKDPKKLVDKVTKELNTKFPSNPASFVPPPAMTESNPNADETREADKAVAAAAAKAAKATDSFQTNTGTEVPLVDFTTAKVALIDALENCLKLLTPLKGSPLDINLSNYDAANKARGKILGAIHFIHTITE